MEAGLYVALSGQLAMQRRLDTLAYNVANASTPGFRAEEIKFEALLSKVSTETSFASTGDNYISRRAGAVERTGNALDVAVDGDAWMSFQSPAGIVYTRDGRLTMTDNGDLQTVSGYPVLDVGGAPIQLDPAGGVPTIAHDGMITQNGVQLGAIGLFTIPDGTKLNRHENSGVMPEGPVQPALEFNSVGIRQGYLERANVNPIVEITQLITISRAFESLTNSVDQTDATFRKAIDTLGEPTR